LIFCFENTDLCYLCPSLLECDQILKRGDGFVKPAMKSTLLILNNSGVMRCSTLLLVRHLSVCHCSPSL